MGGFRGPRWGMVAALTVLSACAAPTAMDLGRNPTLYRATGYRVAVPAELAAFVAPVRDARTALPTEASGPYPVDRLPDAAWERSPAEMVDGIVRDELADSGVFQQVAPKAEPGACVVEVDLERFEAALQELVEGRRALAAVQLRVRVLGRAGADGTRAVLFDDVFPEATQSEVGMRPPNPRTLLGMALRNALKRVQAALDQANVARPSVPTPARNG